MTKTKTFSGTFTYHHGRTNKKRQEIAEIDFEIMRRVNRIGGRYRPWHRIGKIEPENNGNQKEEENQQARQNPVEVEGGEDLRDSPEVTQTEDSVVVRRNNLPTVNLRKNYTDGDEAHYIKIN